MSYDKVVPVVSNQMRFPEKVQLQVTQNGRSENDMDVTVTLTCESESFFLYKVKVSSRDFISMKEKQELRFNFCELFEKITMLIDEVANTNSSLFLNVRAHGLREYYLEIKEQQPTRYFTHLVLDMYEGSAEEIKEHAQATIADLRNVIRNLQSEVEQSHKTTSELKDEIKMRDSLIKDKEENIKKTLEELVVEKSEARKWYEQQLSNIEKSRDSELKNLYDALKTIQGEKINCEATLTSLRSENKKIFEQLEAIKQMEKDSEAKYKLLFQENASNHQKLDEALKSLRSAKAMLYNKHEEGNRLQNEIQRLRMVIQDFTHKKQELDSILEIRNKEIDQLEEKLKCFQEKYTSLGQDLRKSHSIIRNLNCILEEKETNNKKIAEDIKTLTSAHESQFKEITRLKVEIKSKEQSVIQLKEDMKKKEEEIVKLKEEKESKAKSLRYLTTELMDLKINLKKPKAKTSPTRGLDSYYNLKFAEQSQSTPSNVERIPSPIPKVPTPEPLRDLDVIKNKTPPPPLVSKGNARDLGVKSKTPPSTLAPKENARENELPKSKTPLQCLVRRQTTRDNNTRAALKKTTLPIKY